MNCTASLLVAEGLDNKIIVKYHSYTTGIVPAIEDGRETLHIDTFMKIVVDEISGMNGLRIYDTYRCVSMHILF